MTMFTHSEGEDKNTRRIHLLDGTVVGSMMKKGSATHTEVHVHIPEFGLREKFNSHEFDLALQDSERVIAMRERDRRAGRTRDDIQREHARFLGIGHLLDGARDGRR